MSTYLHPQLFLRTDLRSVHVGSIKISIIKNSGSGVVKAGFAGEEAPRSVFPCITGVPKEQSVMMTSTKNKYVGELAEKKR